MPAAALYAKGATLSVKLGAEKRTRTKTETKSRLECGTATVAPL